MPVSVIDHGADTLRIDGNEVQAAEVDAAIAGQPRQDDKPLRHPAQYDDGRRPRGLVHVPAPCRAAILAERSCGRDASAAMRAYRAAYVR
jgi:hypothetical protein